MILNFYIGNMDYSVGEEQVSDLFAAYGVVEKVTILKEQITGQSKGFGFVTLKSDSSAEQIIAQLNGSDFHGRTIVVQIKK